MFDLPRRRQFKNMTRVCWLSMWLVERCNNTLMQQYYYSNASMNRNDTKRLESNWVEKTYTSSQYVIATVCDSIFNIWLSINGSTNMPRQSFRLRWNTCSKAIMSFQFRWNFKITPNIRRHLHLVMMSRCGVHSVIDILRTGALCGCYEREPGRFLNHRAHQNP